MATWATLRGSVASARILALAMALGAPVVHGSQTLLDILVVDKLTENPIEGLGAGDFEVLQGRVIIELSECSAQRPSLEIVLLVDSGVGGLPSVLADGARQALADLRPDDRVAVMTFGGGSQLQLPFTNDWDAVARELDRISRSPAFHRGAVFGANRSGPKICEALLKAVRLFQEPRDCLRRRMIVIATDDRRSPAKILESDVVAALLAAHVTLSGAKVTRPLPRDVPLPPTGLPRLPRPSKQPEPCCQATAISNATGGDLLRYSFPGRRAPVGGALLEKLLRRIRGRYSFCYTPSPPLAGSDVSRIQVRLTGVAKLSHPDVEIRFRSSNCPGESCE